ncbi:hypothetical protein BDN70DRAFT_816725 [Pholiota conissans]|uniref:Uncharacterized protein n=1 Tax=Pholiota conissans TaxID=109636 RepID=A0A9P5YQ08_9AGAR|nr:hypothetical protein BDN70DRAFT_816725 [Pholiota conissans]
MTSLDCSWTRNVSIHHPLRRTYEHFDTFNAFNIILSPSFLAFNHNHTAVSSANCVALKERKFGVELDVAASTILSTFSLEDRWLCLWPNITLQVIFFVTFAMASFMTLHFYVKEK